MWIRKRIDIGWSDIAYGIVRSCGLEHNQAVRKRLERLWSPEGDALACLSVRSGFDLLLEALDWDGVEVLMSAWTVRDMVRIVEHHGLTPVPVDVDPDRLVPRLDEVRKAITPRTSSRRGRTCLPLGTQRIRPVA